MELIIAFLDFSTYVSRPGLIRLKELSKEAKELFTKSPKVSVFFNVKFLNHSKIKIIQKI